MAKAVSLELASTDVVVAQKHFDVILRSDGIVWLRRTAELYATIDDVHRAYGEFLRVVDEWLLDRRIKSGSLGTRTRTPMAWLSDVRNAPARRNDPEFEKVIQDRRADLVKRSPVLSVLVQSATGKMQMTRMGRTGSSTLLVFDDFDKAVASLLEGMKLEFSPTGG